MTDKMMRQGGAGIAAAIEKWGMKTVFRREGQEHVFKAFIQPDLNRNRKFLEEDYTPMGRTDRGRWIYRGPARGAGAMIKQGDILSCPAGSFCVVVIEDYFFGEMPVYRSGWLEPVNSEGGVV